MASDVPPSPGLNMDHGFVKKIEQHQYHRQQQAQGDQARRQEAAKLARKVGITTRNAKPTRQIYKPPSMRNSFSTEDFGSLHMSPQHGAMIVHQEQEQLVTNGIRNSKVTFNLEPVKPPAELKSALKRSKSFGGSEALESALLDREALPREYEALVKKALDNPNVLSSRQLMEVVRVLCNKAVENSQSAEYAAQMCFTIIQKEKGETFLESLMNSCREWFNERDKLLPRYSGVGSPQHHHRRWTAYVAFLTELYMRLNSRHHQLNISQGEASTGHSYVLLALLYECCQIILSTVAYNNVAEIECLRSVLMTVGRLLEGECPERMLQLTALMRDAFLVPSVNAQVRKTLLELVELHASKWTLDLPQSMYYFPYTSMDRKGL